MGYFEKDSVEFSPLLFLSSSSDDRYRYFRFISKHNANIDIHYTLNFDYGFWVPYEEKDERIGKIIVDGRYAV